MLRWSITFFLLAIIAAVFGFSGLAGTFAWAAQFLFVAFIALFVIMLIANVLSGNKTNPPI